MQDPQLTTMVDRATPRAQQRRRRIAAAVFVVGGLGATFAALTCVIVPPASPPPPAPPPATVIVQVPTAPAIVEVPVPVAVTLPGPALDCPVLDAIDAPIGAAIPPPRLEGEETALEPAIQVVAAGARIAVCTAAGQVFVSDDDGRHFRRAFGAHGVAQIAIDRDGRLYARDGIQLGRLDRDGREHWHQVELGACPEREDCTDRIAVVGTRVVWMHDDQLGTSDDRGRTWRAVSTADATWESQPGRTLVWNGALYQLRHDVDRCGVDDWSVWRLDGARQIRHAIFRAPYVPGGSVVVPDDDVGTSWRWRERCWQDPEILAPCPTRDPVRVAMRTAATVLPIEGGRTLGVYRNSLIELCRGGVRQIYRSYPLDHVDAVDAAGLPLVVHGEALLRWSPIHGWRRLFTLPAP